MTTGRVTDLDVDYASDTLLVDVAADARVLPVKSVLDFADPEDGTGWVVVGDLETPVPRRYVAVDGDADTLTLAEDPGEILTAGSTVYAWDPTTAQGSPVVEYVAVVDRDEAKPIPGVIVPHHLVAFSDVEYLRGASVVIEENDDGEWEIAEVLAREPVLDARFLNLKFDDAHHTVTADDLTGETFTFALDHEPVADSEHFYLNGLEYPESAGWSRTGRNVTVDSVLVREGDSIDVEYAYRTGLARTLVQQIIVPFGSTGWAYKQVAESDPLTPTGSGYDDSAWAVGQAAFGVNDHITGLPTTTLWEQDTRLWLRRRFDAAAGVTVHVKVEDNATVWINGTLVGSTGIAGPGTDNINPGTIFEVPDDVLNVAGNVLVIRADDEYDSTTESDDPVYVDVQVEGQVEA